MSRFSIDETYPDPQPENAGTGLIASVTINPERPFIAAASALAAHMAGSDLILARAAARPESATDMIRDLLESARVPLAVDLGCSGVLNAIALKEAGADAVVISCEAILNPGLVTEITEAIGASSSFFQVDCRALGPEQTDVIDCSGRGIGIDCTSWLKRLESLGARNVILRPRSCTPSEALLPVFAATGLDVHIERPGWGLALARALGAKGLVTEGALGCREQLEWLKTGVMEEAPIGGSS